MVFAGLIATAKPLGYSAKSSRMGTGVKWLEALPCGTLRQNAEVTMKNSCWLKALIW